ncbi:MAG: mRNA surveillance protein pelota [Thermoplasmata archaeon]|nr:mRNA surveillance protein pelota [Thermoplasmata archaeon]
MRILKEEEDGTRLKVRVDSMSDLWYLYQILSRGSFVGGITWRKSESRTDMIRPDASTRKKVYLEIEVEDVEFQPFTDNLRIKGKIVKAPQDISGYHTFNVDPGTVLDIGKDPMPGVDRALLDEARRNSTRPSFRIISLDDEEATLIKMLDYGMEQVATIKVGGGGKRYGGGGRWSGYYEEIIKAYGPASDNDVPLVIIGPGFFKEALMKEFRKRLMEDAPKMIAIPASAAGMAGVREVLSKGDELHDIVSRSRVAQEASLLNRFMEMVGKGEGAAYGPEEVRSALDMGAVEVLIISDTVFRTDIGKELLSMAPLTGARTMVISSLHDNGRMFDRMGGVGALLRYEVEG